MYFKINQIDHVLFLFTEKTAVSAFELLHTAIYGFVMKLIVFS